MKTGTKIAACFLFFICSVFHCIALAQPDAGSMLRDQAPRNMLIPDRLAGETERTTDVPAVSGNSAVVFIKGFEFTGYEDVARETELQGLVKANISRNLDIAGLRQIVSMITRYLREEKGYFLARAYLPEQDITEGIITIAIIPGKIDGRVKIHIREPSRINPSLLQDIADQAVPKESPVLIQGVERAVMLMKDLPGIDADASVEPGETPGSGRLIINVSEDSLFKGHVSGDNQGDRYTGIYRATGGFSLSDPSGHGDELDLYLREADSLELWGVAYSIPMGSTGFRFRGSYTGLSYDLGKEFAVLNAGGRAKAISADIDYPMVLTSSKKFRTGAGIEQFILEDEANLEKTSDRDIKEGRLFVSGHFLDGLLGGGLTSGRFVIAAGDVDLSGLPSNKAIDDAGAGTSGNYSRGIYYMSRLQRVTGPFSLFASARGQFASGNLDSSRKFILGGPMGVRAYPVGEAPGDEGHLFTLEARADLPFMPDPLFARLKGFFDAGRIRLHKEPWPGSVTNISNRNSYSLRGAGIGVSVSSGEIYELSATYAHELGSNDGASTDGNDADNLDHDGRFWLDLTVRF